MKRYFQHTNTLFNRKEFYLPSRKLTSPTMGKGKSSSKVPAASYDILVPWRVLKSTNAQSSQRSISLHPGRLTWNLQITHLERKMIFQTSMLMFQPLIFRGIRQTKTWDAKKNDPQRLRKNVHDPSCATAFWGRKFSVPGCMMYALKIFLSKDLSHGAESSNEPTIPKKTPDRSLTFHYPNAPCMAYLPTFGIYLW